MGHTSPRFGIGACGLVFLLCSAPACGDKATEALPKNSPEGPDGGLSSSSSGGGSGAAGSDAGYIQPTGIAEGPQGARCVRVNTPMPYASNAHIISAGAVQGIPEPAVVVNVADTGAPAQLYLTSSKGLKWKVVPGPNAKIARVFVSSYENKATIEGVPPADVVVRPFKGSLTTIEPNPITSGAVNATGQLADAREAFGGVETTLQAVYYASTFDVPAAPSAVLAQKQIQLNDVRDKCVDACPSPSDTAFWAPTHSVGTNTVEGKKVTVNTVTAGGSSLIKGLRGFACGKHYFELTTTSTSPQLALGVGFKKGSDLDSLALSRFREARVGVALDLDNDWVYFRNATGYTCTSGIGGCSDPQVGPLGEKGYKLDRVVSGEVVPVARLDPGDSVTLVDAAPTFPVPPGFTVGFP